MSLDDRELSAMIRGRASRHVAPEGLRAAIRTQTTLAEAGRTSSQAPSGPARQVLRWPLSDLRRGAIPASFALGMLCMLLALPLVQRLDFREALDAELVAGHVRALRVGPIAEVASTDRHTVKPWFQGRLDFAPPVVDLAGDGYPLVGGRIEQLRGDVVAALAYTRRQHVVDVFIWPSADHQPPLRTLRRGFTVIHWADGSMQYWAVSDMDAGEMENFARVWRERAAAN